VLAGHIPAGQLCGRGRRGRSTVLLTAITMPEMTGLDLADSPLAQTREEMRVVVHVLTLRECDQPSTLLRHAPSSSTPFTPMSSAANGCRPRERRQFS